MQIKSEFATEKFNEHEFAVICYLSQFKNEKEYGYFTAENIIRDLTISLHCSEYDVCNFNNAIKSLIKKEVLSLIGEDEQGYYLHIGNCQVKENDFNFRLFKYELDKIMMSRRNDRFLLLKTYSVILSCLDFRIFVTANNLSKNKVICHMPLSFLAEKIGCSKYLLLKYINVLEDLQVLYVVRKCITLETENYKTKINIYIVAMRIRIMQ